MKTRAVLLLMFGILFSVGCGLLQQATAADDKGPVLNGTWVCNRLWDGRRDEWDSSKSVRLTFNGSQVDVQENGCMIVNGLCTIRHDTEPQEIDLSFTLEGEQIQIPGIFSVSNSILTLCHPAREDGVRPTNFEPSKDVSIAICKKVDKKKQESKDKKKEK